MQHIAYNPQEIEPKYYEIWEARGYFEPDSNAAISNGENFCIMMPPPNITGALHMGHALTYTLQDIITRYKRMDGFRTLWQPGIDHAGIATQNVVEKQLLKRGITKESIGREAFLEEVWKWKRESGDMILSQLRRLGASPSWKRLRFTMDKGLQNAVKKAFVAWYERGLIERGDYMVNWCTHDGALSDIEVEYEENKGKLYYLRYALEDSGECVIVATTRPETYFGDTAVMINPNDERYRHLVGKSVILPLIGRKIPIICDEIVDMGFGTGCVKVTPAHDNNDYEVGKRHNLAFITIFDKNGILNEYCWEFAGLERLEAREVIVSALERGGFVEKIEPYTNQVGKCYRCGNVVEPYISKQWFVKRDIARESIAKVNAGEMRFYPSAWLNNYNAWMSELRPWCISRQLWWGHRIPVFYCDSCGVEIASVEDAVKCAKCGCEMRQDSDVLDTWFSSGLWAFSTLGWGNLKDSVKNTAGDSVDSMRDSVNVAQDSTNATQDSMKNATDSTRYSAKDSVESAQDSTDSTIESLYNDSDLRDFYPNSLLITSFDILFFWVARMVFSGESLLGKLPFKDVYLHALVCDEFGQKQSKSRGNVINPLSAIKAHSSDILRFTLAYHCVQGRDIRLGEGSFEIGSALNTKILNALNFLLLYKEQQGGDFIEIGGIKSALGGYISARFYECVRDVRGALDNYRFNDAANALYRFLFNDFCDWGIELVKAQKDAVCELGGILAETMKLLHPFMPFLSEFVWHTIKGTSLEGGTSIMLEKFPTAKSVALNADFETIKDIITTIRRAKIAIDCANKAIPLCYIKPKRAVAEDLVERFVPKLAKCEQIALVSEKVENCVFDMGAHCEIYLPTANIKLDEILARLSKKEEKIRAEIQKLESMLNNENFLANAPQTLVLSHKDSLKTAQDKLAKILTERKSLES